MKVPEDLALGDRVRFPDSVNQSQPESACCAADLLIVSSPFDSFGLLVNEAMLCWLPVAINDRVVRRRLETWLRREDTNSFM
jgi:hypothetical protein